MLKNNILKAPIALLLCLALIHCLVVPGYISYAEDEAEKEREYVKIGIAYGSGGVSQAEFSTAYGFTACDISEGSPEPLYELEDGNKLKVTPGLFDVNTAIFPLDSEGGLDEGGSIQYGGKEYRGGFCFFTSSAGSMNVINYVDREEYLYSVLAAEIGASAPKEAQKTQAVAARSFVIASASKHKSEGFSLCNTTHCQVYRGKSEERSSTIEAVDETRDLVLKYEGKVVSGLYSSNSGGYTLNNENMWGGSPVGYLRAVRDEYAPALPWSFYLSFSDLEKKLSDSGNSVGLLQSAEISKRAEGGNVLEMTFRGSAGTKTLSLSRLRSLFGANTLKSAMFTIDSKEISYDENGTALPKSKVLAFILRALGAKKEESIDSGSYVLGAGGRLEQLNHTEGSDYEVLSGKQKITGGNVYFNGLGWGHSVGMSQQSTIEMAKLGWEFRDILEYFYTDITIEEL